MRGPAIANLLVALLALAIGGCGGSGSSDDPSTSSDFDAARAFRDLKAQVKLGPRPSGSPAAARAANLIARSLRAAGVDEVEVQRPYANVVGTVPGSEPGFVVVGAHYDTKDGIPGFVGANDGASGVAVLLELARTLPRPLPGPAVELVAFDAEETRGERAFEVDGTRGSRQFVDDARAGGEQGAPPLDQLRAMVLFDMVGDCELAIPRERSSDAGLYDLFAEASQEITDSEAPFEGMTGPILDDHVPFLEAGIPALDLIDFDYGPGPTPGGWWHTPEDTLEHVCPASLNAVGEAALRAIPRIR
ncbi:MAG TPA: M28 family metallopeptidase [Solirubrobacterales bacterium]|nr:M28 family metallopeptidase [Solirubrobacterales bacterium]